MFQFWKKDKNDVQQNNNAAEQSQNVPVSKKDSDEKAVVSREKKEEDGMPAIDKMVTAVERNLRAANIKYTFRDSNKSKVFFYDVNHKGIFNSIRIIIFVESNNIQIYSACPMDADPKNIAQMAKLAEFMCRINMRMKLGHFDLNFDDGCIRYATSMYCNGDVPDGKSLDAARMNALAMMITCAEGISALLLSDISAKKAFEKAIK